MTRWSLMLVSLLLAAQVAAGQPDYSQFIFQTPQGTQSFFQKYLKFWDQPPFDGSYAIIIAIGDYSALPKLDTVRYDAGKMKRFLLDSGEYDEVVVLQDEDADYQTIRYFMQRYFTRKMMKPGRYRFLFYFAGHGTQQRGARDKIIGYLQLQQATGSPDDIDVIPMTQVQDWADRFRYARHLLFLLDCCFSGSAGVEVRSNEYDTQVDPLILAKESGRFMLTAGGADEFSIADLTRWGGGLFTDVVLSGMSGKADANGDGVVTTYELFSYTQSAVRNEAQRVGHAQTPLLTNLGSPYADKGQFFFVYQDIAPHATPTPEATPAEQRGAVQATPTPLPTEWIDPITGMEFVWIPGGRFQMGCVSGSSECDDDETPVHEVIVDGFWMGKYEVTNAQYRQWKRGHDSKEYEGHSLNGDDQPVVYVSWEEAVTFTEWLTDQHSGNYTLVSLYPFSLFPFSGGTGGEPPCRIFFELLATSQLSICSRG